MATPSLAMIPSGYKASKVYSVLPESGVGDFDFTRATTATRVNSSGLIEEMAINVPRLEYPLIDGVVNGCPSLLLEPQSTNLITYSEDATNWNTQSSSVLATSNQAISPDGTLNADKLIPASGSVTSNGGRYVSFSSTGGADYSVSVFVKQGEYRYVTFSYGSSAAYGFHFDLQDGVIIQELNNAQYTPISREAKSFGNGWYRLSISLTDTLSVGSRFISVRPANELPTAINNNYATTGDGTSGIYAWGLQIEESSYSTSYIPTNGSSVTRNAETCNGAGDAATFNDSEGVLMAEISALVSSDGSRDIEISDGNTNRIIIQYNSIGTIQVYVLVNGVATYTFGYTTLITQFNKIALKYKENDFALWVDGFEADSSNSGSVFSSNTLTQLDFLKGVNSSLNFYGNTKQLQYYNSVLTDSELEQLTSWTSFSDMANGQQYSII